MAYSPRLFAAFVLTVLVPLGSSFVRAQTDANPPAAANPAQLAVTDALNALQPLLPQVNSAAASVDVHRWKVPGDVKEQTAADLQSIQKDLNGALPDLLNKAQSAPNAVAPSFAVFRNIDALYDVLLRVTETATLAGAQGEAAKLEQVRTELQSRRSQLGSALMTSAAGQDASVVQMRASLDVATRAAAAAQQGAAKKVVVNDGPDAAAKPVRRKKPSAAKPIPAPGSTPPTQ